MLDFSIIDPRHFWLSLAAFTITAIFITAIIISRPKTLQLRNKKIYYTGLIIIFTTVFLATTILAAGLLIGLIISALILAIGGFLDEKLSLSPKQQFIWQLAAVVSAVSLGWTIPHVTNPLGPGLIYLNSLGSFLAIAWLLLIINSINWLDGVDGLAGGVSLIAFIALIFISLLPATQDQLTFQLALIGLGLTAAFLLFNWPPAKIYLGTSGAWFLGIYLGLVAMIGGGKIATTLLVLSLPILDAIFVIIQRLLNNQQPWRGRDAKHLHYRLKAIGLTPTQITSSAMALTLILALAALALPTNQKIIIIGFTALLLSMIIATLIRHAKNT